MELLNFLGGIFNLDKSVFGDDFSWLYPIASFLESMLIPVTIILGVLGALWVIYLGVQLAKAEGADKQKEAKRNLINVAVALIAVIIFVWLLSFFVSQVPTIFAKSGISSFMVTL